MSRPRPVLVVAGRHRPHEIAFLAFSLMVGAVYLLSVPPPQSAAATMPTWMINVWAAGLALSGLVGLPAVLLHRDAQLSLRLEAGAMLLGAGALLIITAAIFSYAGIPRGLFGGGFCVAWMAANLIRYAQIQRDLRGLR